MYNKICSRRNTKVPENRETKRNKKKSKFPFKEKKEYDAKFSKQRSKLTQVLGIAIKCQARQFICCENRISTENLWNLVWMFGNNSFFFFFAREFCNNSLYISMQNFSTNAPLQLRNITWNILIFAEIKNKISRSKRCVNSFEVEILH